ncbi:hypothetical protein [Burkholderia glumae]
MPNFRCKVGDLAIITSCAVPERIGLIVKVIERRDDRGYDWLTEVHGFGVRGRDITTGQVGRCKYLLMHDASLTPIRPDLLDTNIETHEVDHA